MEEDKDRNGGTFHESASDYWFRGHANASWDLRPRIYRADFRDADENELRTEFKRRGRQLMLEPSVPSSDREWYFMMQHYKTPTRLLDWTDGALLGLYFAVSTPGRRSDAAVWMLDPKRLNRITLGRVHGEANYLEGPLLPEWKESDPWFPVPWDESVLVAEPVAIDPPHVVRRVAVQHSHFTVHGRRRSSLESQLSREAKARLVKIIIPRRAVAQVFRDLTACGLTETTVYPDLEGLSRELCLEWAHR